MPGLQRAEPPYLQVFSYYQRRILNGQMREGDPMPSVRKIAGEWSISSATAGKVLGALQSEGLVESRVGTGTVVTTRRAAPSGRERLIRRQTTGRLYHPGERAEVVHAELRQANAELAVALRINEGDPVISRRRIVYQDDAPVEVSTSYIPGGYLEHAPDLVKVGKLPVSGGTVGYIEDRFPNVRIQAGRDQNCCRPATEQECSDLQLEHGAMVLGGRNWWMTEPGEVVEYGESAVVPHRWRTEEYRLEPGTNEEYAGCY